MKFRRQKVIGDYIADFAANDPKLVIELDGDSHARKSGMTQRERHFLKLRVIRCCVLAIMM